MDYFFHEFDDIDDDYFGEEGFYIFLSHQSSVCYARLRAGPFNLRERRRRSFL